MKKILLTAAGLSLVAAQSLAATQGVSDTEVVIGSHNDLSGPFAAFGAPATKAAQLYFDEINAAGGVHGRKIKFVVEDHGYQVPKAVQAVNKLVNRDKVFAMLLSAARQMVQDPISNKFAGTASYYDAVRATMNYMAKEKGAKVMCAMYIPSDFGKEIKLAAEDEAKALGLKYAAETTHKPDETDYVGSLGKLKEAGCDTVAVALSVRGVITAVATAKKIGWKDVNFVGSSAAFHTAIAKVPGGVTDGFYAGAGWQDLEARAKDPEVGKWIASYTKATGEKFPGTGALLGRSGAEVLVRALEAAGKDLTNESFIKAMEGLKYADKIMGNNVDVGADHVAASQIFISQVSGGSWKVIGEAK